MIKRFLKNYFLFFDNSKSTQKVNGDLQTFSTKKLSKVVVDDLIARDISQIILLYRRRTKICYYYCSEKLNWEEVRDEFLKEFKTQYEFMGRKKMSIKEERPLMSFLKNKRGTKKRGKKKKV